MDARFKRILNLAVRYPFGNGKPNVQGKADRVGAITLSCRRRLELKRRRRVTRGAHKREVVTDVHRKHSYYAGLSVRCTVFEPVLARVLHPLCYNVVVRYE